MLIAHEFTIPMPADAALEILTDVPRIVPCMPGATLTSSDGDLHQGQVKIKVGPMLLTYSGQAEFTKIDRDSHIAVLEARGREIKGTGEVSANIEMSLSEGDGVTVVRIAANLDITGRLAQFGRGAIADVSSIFLGQFVDNLNQLLANSTSASEEGQPASSRPTVAPSDHVDALAIGRAALAGRLRSPAVMGGVVVALLLVAAIRRSHHRNKAELTATAFIASLSPEQRSKLFQ